MKHQYSIQTLKSQIFVCNVKLKELEAQDEFEMISDTMFVDDGIKELKANVKKLQAAIKILLEN